MLTQGKVKKYKQRYEGELLGFMKLILPVNAHYHIGIYRSTCKQYG